MNIIGSIMLDLLDKRTELVDLRNTKIKLKEVYDIDSEIRGLTEAIKIILDHFKMYNEIEFGVWRNSAEALFWQYNIAKHKAKMTSLKPCQYVLKDVHKSSQDESPNRI